MMITKVKPKDVIEGCRYALGLPSVIEKPIDDLLLAALLRRSAGIHCPCSRVTLRATLVENLQYLSDDGSPLTERIDAIIEGLIVGGDLLELNDIATDDPAAKGTWIFAAPPCFVVRPIGGIFLVGIVPDQETFLPQALTSRINYENFTRMIVPDQDEDLPAELREQGLQQLSEGSWMRCPKPESAVNMLGRFQSQLTLQPPSGTMDSLQILDPTQSVTYYRGRWTSPKSHSGAFVGRRPQEYGMPIWCFVSIEDGTPVKLLDLTFTKTRWRGCDMAWHLQMAIDYCSNTPQLYRHRRLDDGVRLDFFSPLPKWSERRLMILGRPLTRENCLMSYLIPSTESDTEELFLQKRLWLSRMEDSD